MHVDQKHACSMAKITVNRPIFYLFHIILSACLQKFVCHFELVNFIRNYVIT